MRYDSTATASVPRDAHAPATRRSSPYVNTQYAKMRCESAGVLLKTLRCSRPSRETGSQRMQTAQTMSYVPFRRSITFTKAQKN